MAGLTLKHISKIYSGEITAVSDFNLEIRDGEFIIFVGPSGCGKSTTLRMIAGLEDISSGELYIGNRHMNNIEPGDRDVSMVFQNYALYPHMTIYENIAFGLKIRKIPKEEITHKVDEAAQILDISHLLKRKPKALSGGERQRVALGRAIVREPQVFLLDEPLSNLDAKLRSQMRTEIIKLHKRLGTTFVYVTHDQTEAMTMGDRICIMKDGVIQQVDTPQNLYRMPCNQFVAGFIGSPQMNFIDATVCRLQEIYFLRFNLFTVKLPQSIYPDTILSDYMDRHVILGIRPEHIIVGIEGLSRGEADVITARVEVVEMMGAEAYLNIKCDELNVVSRVDPETTLAPGDTVTLTMNSLKIHLFDGDTGVHVLSGRKT